MRTTKDKSGVTTFHYKVKNGESQYTALLRESQNCDKVIKDTSEYLDWYKWNYEKAKKEYESRVNKISNHKDWKDLAQEIVSNLILSRDKVVDLFKNQNLVFSGESGYTLTFYGSVEEILSRLENDYDSIGLIFDHKKYLKFPVEDIVVTVTSQLRDDHTFGYVIGKIEVVKGDENKDEQE